MLCCCSRQQNHHVLLYTCICLSMHPCIYVYTYMSPNIKTIKWWSEKNIDHIVKSSVQLERTGKTLPDISGSLPQRDDVPHQMAKTAQGWLKEHDKESKTFPPTKSPDHTVTQTHSWTLHSQHYLDYKGSSVICTMSWFSTLLLALC